MLQYIVLGLKYNLNIYVPTFTQTHTFTNVSHFNKAKQILVTQAFPICACLSTDDR